MAVILPISEGQPKLVSPDRRQSQRYSLSGMAYVMSDGKSVEIGRVRDISLSGCFIHSQQMLSMLVPLQFRFNVGAEFDITGFVCRKEDKGFAVHFNGNA